MAKLSKGKVLSVLIGFVAVVIVSILGLTFYHSTASIHQLLTENHKPNKAVRNLTHETQIGYALIQSQSYNGLGELENTVRFVQTAIDDPKVIVCEQHFTVSSNIVHFDALIVKFTNDYVKDGSERALYLWRRIYTESTAPAEGTPIETLGSAPQRYDLISKSLHIKNRDIFWKAIWDLANNTAQLSNYGIEGVYGNAIYTRMQPGKVYLFKISSTGQIYPETVEAY